MKLLMTALATGAALSMATAQAALIDFSALPEGTVVSTYTEAGVTFTAVDGSAFSFSETPNTTRGLLPGGTPLSPFRADIAGGASAVSVDVGDFGIDQDQLFLRAFSASDVLLGEATDFLDFTDAVMRTLSVTASGIAYAIFGSEFPSRNGSSVYVDNFSFTPVDPGTGAIDAAVVPVPAALPLMVFGLAGLLAVARGRRKR